ncbi:MAG: hypothetical protein KDD04_05060, partial [Sinomicrobium sp.]|nr:hypothetical protein [Sinomicrobium sp.]
LEFQISSLSYGRVSMGSCYLFRIFVQASCFKMVCYGSAGDCVNISDSEYLHDEILLLTGDFNI